VILKGSNYFSHLFLKSDLKEFEKEFEEIRSKENIKRNRILAIALIALNALLIVVDMLVYKPLRGETPAYLYLYLSHLVVIAFLSLWLISLEFNRRNSNFISEKTFNNTFIYIVIGWCTFMGINSITITGGIIAYIVCMFTLAAAYFATPFEAFCIYSISSIVFIIGLVLFTDNPNVLYSNLVNTLITFILVQITSILNYTYFSRDFINKKHILQSKEKLEAANQKLEEYEKLRTDFFSNISHELRTPLNVIYSAEQMLDTTISDNNFDYSKINKYNKMIKQNTYRLLRLINNLIDITKIDSSSFIVKLTNADIIKIVEDITLSVADFIEHKGITLTFDTDIEEKILACDPDNIERIMLNLLSNAVKYGKEKGVIFVRVFQESSTLCISVKDDGAGIPEKMQGLIFDRFMQIDSSLNRLREGSGIGLALVKSLVEVQGGKISVKSKIGEGSEFIVSLPDTIISESKEAFISSQSEEDYISRINIEFSDIYS